MSAIVPSTFLALAYKVVIPGSGVNGYAVLKFANMLVTGGGFIALAYIARQATVVTQNAVSELVTDIMTKKFGRKSIEEGEDDRLLAVNETGLDTLVSHLPSDSEL
jgi:hypothetical protein